MRSHVLALFVTFGLPFTTASGAVPKSAALLALPVVKQSTTVTLSEGDTYTLTAAYAREKIDGKWVKRLAYNGMIPGPTFVAKQNTKAKIKLVNKTDVSTTLHPHGLRVDDKNDGVVGIGQDPILPGGSFTYSLVFPDLGLYWYHPHMKEEFTQEMGLYGQYLVIPSNGPASGRPKGDEVVVLDDLLVKDGQLPHFDTGDVSFALMGRYGNRLLVNNRPEWKKSYQQGQVVRMYFVNTSNVRPFRIGFDKVRMKVVGGDNGFYERDFFADEIIIAPAERYVVDVLFDNAGQVVFWHRGEDKKSTLGRFTVKPSKTKTDGEFLKLAVRPSVTEDMKAVRSLAASAPNHTMTLDSKLSGEHAEHMAMAGHSADGIEWEDDMGAMSADMTQKNVQWIITDPATGKTNMDIHWKFSEGVPVKIRIENKGKSHPMQHPIHFHGQRFIVLSTNGKAESNLVWKDTVMVPAGHTVDVVLDNLNPGRWMGHCHIAEHLSVGMMFGFDVLAKK